MTWPLALFRPKARALAWLLGSALCCLSSVLSLVVLYQASFGPSPSIDDAHHVLFGQVSLLGFGCLGTVISTCATFQLLQTFRPWTATAGIVCVCLPSLVLSLCQLWAWAMFVGLA